MLGIAGGLACLGSYACGQLDAHVGSKKAILITQVIAIVAIVLNLIPTKPTQYLSLPFLAMMLGGASNYLYPWQTPSGAVMTSQWHIRC